MIVFDDGREIGGGIALLVQRAAECEALVEEGADAMAAQTRAELAEIADAARPAVDEHVALGPARDPGDPAAIALAGHHRLMHVSFDGRGDRGVGLTLERERDVSRQRVLAKQPPDLRVVGRRGEADVEAARGRGAGRAQCARSSVPSHASSPSGKPSRRFVSTRSMPLIGKKFRNMKKSDRFTASSPRRAMLGQA